LQPLQPSYPHSHAPPGYNAFVIIFTVAQSTREHN